jgi:hypothetical protein
MPAPVNSRRLSFLQKKRIRRGAAGALTSAAGRKGSASYSPSPLHRPLASTDGSLTRNLNKTAVRLWA